MKDGHDLFSFRAPIEFWHPPLSHQGSKHLGEIIACDYDRYSLDPIPFPPLLANWHLIWRVADVHKGAHHHLVVHLRIVSFAAFSFLPTKAHCKWHGTGFKPFAANLSYMARCENDLKGKALLWWHTVIWVFWKWPMPASMSLMRRQDSLPRCLDSSDARLYRCLIKRPVFRWSSVAWAISGRCDVVMSVNKCRELSGVDV